LAESLYRGQEVVKKIWPKPTSLCLLLAKTYSRNQLGKSVETYCSGMFGKYEYHPDPYERKDELARQEAMDHKMKHLSGTSPLNRSFNSPGKSGLFSTPKGEQYSPAGSKEVSAFKTQPPLFGVFKPNNPPKNGYNKTLNPHPFYLEEQQD